MTTHDDAFSDSVAVFALGALAHDEAAAVAAHLASCVHCRREYDDLRAVADVIGYQAELPATGLDEVTSARMKSRIMQAVRADVAPPLGEPATAYPGSTVRRSWFPYGLAAAAVLVAAFVSLDDAALHSRVASQTRRVATLGERTAELTAAANAAQRRQRELARQLALVVAPGSRHFTVPAGEVVESHGHIVIALAGIAAPPPGKVYQAWTLSRGAKTVAPSATFAPDSSGKAVIELPESSAALVAVAVSVEPAGGSKSPTSKPAFVRKLS